MFNQSKPPTGGAHWERQTLQRILVEHVTEQRRSRRWNIFFKLLWIALIVLFIYIYVKRDLSRPVITTTAHAAFIDIRGPISEDDPASADAVHDALKSVYKNKQVKGLVLRINSPGGSPVQARQIFDEIVYYRAKYPNIKVYAAIEDLGTSAAYLIAAAADEVYADKASLVGSIGVLIDSFGFVGTMDKIGVQRRLLTAGDHKGMLDPFSPLKPEDEAFVKTQLDLLHQAFIQNVKQGRGNRLKETPDIFSGRFWCGEDALQLGLIDGFGDAYAIARELIKVESVVEYTATKSFLDKFVNRLGASVSSAIMRPHLRSAY